MGWPAASDGTELTTGSVLADGALACDEEAGALYAAQPEQRCVRKINASTLRIDTVDQCRDARKEASSVCNATIFAMN